MSGTVLLCLVGGLAGLSIPSIRLVRESGWTAYLLSPLLSFGFLYAMAFGLRPLLDIEFGVRLVPGAGSPSAQTQAIVLGLVGAWAFAIGAWFCKPQRPVDHKHQFSKGFFWLALAFGLLHAVFAFRAGALTLDLGANRVAYLESLIGNGQVLLSRDLSFVALGVGLLRMQSWRKLSVVGCSAVVLVVVPNLLVSSRSALTQFIFLGLMIAAIQGNRSNKPLKPFWLVTILGSLTLLGLGLGFARGGTDQPGGALRPVVFFAQTFDMAESLELSLLRVEEPLYGQTWVEDALYTYIPRAIDPQKPTTYGATRLQKLVYPELTPADEVLIGTFPVGAWGEAYANFGMVGVFLAMGLLGYLVMRLFVWGFAGAPLGLILFCLTSANALAYTRSIGQFLASLVYLCVLFAITVGLCGLYTSGRARWEAR